VAGPLVGIFIGAYIANLNQIRHWVADNKREESRGFLPHNWAGCTALLHVSIVAEVLFRPQGFHGLDRSGAPRR
jgi:hypothetical protein